MRTGSRIDRIGAIAATLIVAALALSAQARTQFQLLQEGLELLETQGNPRAAITLFEKAASGPDKRIAARALLKKGVALEMLGQQQASQQYELVITRYPEQTDVVAEARDRLAAIARAAPTPRSTPPTVMLRPAWNQGPANLSWFGSVTPDGRVLAYGGRDGIALAEFAAPGSAKVVFAADLSPGPEVAVPSPDGTAVLAQFLNSQGGIDLRRSRPGGPVTTVLSIAPGEEFSGVRWPTPDQIFVRVRHADKHGTLHVVNAEGKSVRVVTVPADGALSPDGRWIVYSAPGSPKDGLLVANTSSGEVATLIEDPYDHRMLAWTVRSDCLLFVSDRTGSTSLWGIAMTGGKATGSPKLLYPDLGRISMVLGVTNEDAYFYLRQTGLVDVYIIAINANGLAAGKPLGAATSFIGSNMGPSFSPDGRTLAFLAEMGVSPRVAIGLRDVALGTQKSITTRMKLLRLPRWSPDGLRLVAKGYDATDRYGFHLVDPQNGATEPLVVVPADLEESLGLAHWSPDGRSLFYTQAIGNRAELRRHDIQTGSAEQVFAADEGSSIGPFDVDRASGAIVMNLYRQRDQSIIIRDAGGVTREIARFIGSERASDVAWSHDGKSIWFVRPLRSVGPNGASAGIWRMSADGHDIQPLGIDMPGIRALAVSPDGRHLAFTAGAPTREPWVLEHFLPTPAAANGAKR